MVGQIIFFIILSAVLLGLTEFREAINAYYFHRVRRKTPLTRSDYIKYHAVLSENFSYYNQLSAAGRAEFINRLVKFISSKTFVGMEDLEVTDNIKTLISASAIQLTFGLENYRLSFFSTIRIYPHYFYSRLFRAELKGGASEAGVLLFSWVDFLKGYEIPDDKYNLGLHEMAHALKLDVLKGEDFDSQFSFYLDNWMEIGSKEFININKKNASFLRSYGGRNMHEFFAVCVEHFFEAPLEFKKRLPDIYNHLCFLLNQDPSNIKGDYKLKPNFAQAVNFNKQLVPIPEKVKKSYKYHAWHWTYSIMLFGIFVGFFLTMILASVTVIGVGEIIKIGIIGALAATVFQFHYLFRNGVCKMGGFLVYLVFGVIPSVCSLFLVFNYLIKPTIVQENYSIQKVYNSKDNGVVFVLENNAYSDCSFVRTVNNEFYYSAFPQVPTHINITFYKGVLGYKILKDQTLVYEE